MSSRLIDAGYSLSVYNRTKSKGEAVVAKGAIWCDTPRQVAESSDIIFTIVGYPKDVEEVYLGKDGLIEGASSGKIFCDMTTTKPSLDIMIASRLAEKGIASPNLFTGGQCYHSLTEWIALEAMERSASRVLAIIEELGR